MSLAPPPHPAAVPALALGAALALGWEWYAAVPPWVVGLSIGLFIGALVAWVSVPFLVRRALREKRRADDTAQRLDRARERTRHADLAEFFFDSLAVMVQAGGHADGRAVFNEVSRGFAEAHGYDRGHFRGRPVLDCVHPDDIPATTDAAARRGRGESVDGFRNRYPTNPERADLPAYIWWEWHAEADPEGYAYPRDVTAEVEAQERVEAAEADRNIARTRALNAAAPLADLAQKLGGGPS